MREQQMQQQQQQVQPPPAGQTIQTRRVQDVITLTPAEQIISPAQTAYNGMRTLVDNPNSGWSEQIVVTGPSGTFRYSRTEIQDIPLYPDERITGYVFLHPTADDIGFTVNPQNGAADSQLVDHQYMLERDGRPIDRGNRSFLAQVRSVAEAVASFVDEYKIETEDDGATLDPIAVGRRIARQVSGGVE